MTSTRRRAVLGAIPWIACLAVGGLPRARAQSGRKRIRGAGATFPAPLYRRWIEEFEKANADVAIEYDAVGSGEGVSRLIGGLVDFAASDAAMTDDQIGKVSGGVRMIPATAGAVAIVYNVPGLMAPLKLPRDLLPAIFAGDVHDWDDARIAAANPEVSLPNRTIAIVARLDSSGTTFALSHHLSAISDRWRSSRGAATRIDWPGMAMLRRGNDGVAGRVLQTEYSIGYVEFGFAQRLGLRMAELQNAVGAFVAPSLASGEAALADSATRMPEDLRLFITDPPGAASYPITTFSWLLLYAKYGDPAARGALVDFVRFGLTAGQTYAAELGYVPLPTGVVDRALAALATLS
jgi:phosphate transport system substrate-binding protein